VNNEMMLYIALFLWVIKGRALALSCHCKWSWISDVSLQLMLMRKRILGQSLLLAQHARKKPSLNPKRGSVEAGKSLMHRVIEFQKVFTSC